MSHDVFQADWLALREPVDHRSRVRGLVLALREEGRRRGWSRVVDLGSGTGSNLRYLSRRIPWAREWTVVDHDAELLARIDEPEGRLAVRAVVADLAEGGLDAVDEVDVVTASALLDLVSEAWVASLCQRCAERGCAGYFALSYDGSVSWDVADDDDAMVREAVNRHQRRDKGLGGALGPDAATTAEAHFRAAGYRTELRASPWHLSGPGDLGLALRLVDGWVAAAVEEEPGEDGRIRSWGLRRRKDLSHGRTGVRVGHVDLLALPSRGGATEDPPGPEAPPQS